MYYILCTTYYVPYTRYRRAAVGWRYTTAAAAFSPCLNAEKYSSEGRPSVITSAAGRLRGGTDTPQTCPTLSGGMAQGRAQVAVSL